MRKLRLAVIILFLASGVLFTGSKIYMFLAVDRTPPVIHCASETLVVSVTADESELLSGVTAFDNRDGDITSGVMVGKITNLLSNNTAKITYLSFDSSNNMGSCTRYLRYTDYEKPRFSLSEPLVFKVKDPISLTGRLKAQDVLDGDISSSIRVSALDVSSNAEGIYYATASVTNSMGDVSSVTLPILVTSSSMRLPTIRLDEYLVYITAGDDFDPREHIVSVHDHSSKPVEPSAVSIDGQVDTEAPGEYHIEYSYTASGRTGISMLTVVVLEKEADF